MEVLPTLGKVDAVVMDPFYGINGGLAATQRSSARRAAAARFVDSPSAEVHVLRCGRLVVNSERRGGFRDSAIDAFSFYPQARDIGVLATSFCDAWSAGEW